MAYWSGDLQKQLKDQCEALRHRFDPSRRFLDRMEDLYDRQLASRQHPLQAMLPQKKWNPTEQAQMRRTLFTSNHVKQMVHSYLDRMERSDIIVNVAMTAKNSAEGEKQHLLEQLCQGLLSRESKKTVDRRQGTTFIRRMSAFAMRRGSIAQRISLDKDQDGKAVITWDLYDPYNTYYTTGGSPKIFFADRYERKDALLARCASMGLAVPKGQAWDKASDSTFLAMTESWHEYEEGGETYVDNVICVADWPVREPTTHKDYGHTPVSVLNMNEGDLEPNASPYDGIVDPVFGIPDRYTERIREPIYASLEYVIPQLEDRLSLEQLGEAFRVAPPKKLKKVGQGSDVIEWEYELFGPDSTVVMPEGWDMEMMNLGGNNSPTASLIVQQHLEQINRVFASVLWMAESGANESGWHLYQRIDQGVNSIQSPSMCVAVAMQVGLEEIIYQGRRSGDTEIDLRVKKDPSFALYEIKTFKFADLPQDGYELDVRVPPMLARDPMAQGHTFQLYTTSGAMDQRHALAEVMSDQDPDGTLKRILQDKVRNDQSTVNQAISDRNWEAVEDLEDAASREEDRATRIHLRKKALQRKAQAEAFDFSVGMKPMTGYINTAQAGNPAPAQQPPEARGAENPAAQRALAGVAQPGGRPASTDGGF